MNYCLAISKHICWQIKFKSIFEISYYNTIRMILDLVNTKIKTKEKYTKQRYGQYNINHYDVVENSI